MITNSVTTLVCMASILTAASSAWSQIWRIDFRSQVTEVDGSPLLGVTVGTIITGRVEVDLATLPPDYDESLDFGGYSYAGGPPGATLQFDTGIQRITYDSINAARDPGYSPGIFVNDEGGAYDFLFLQFRDQDNPYAAAVRFEQYPEPRTLITGDYFPESVNLNAGVSRAVFQYFDGFGRDSVVAQIISVTVSIDGRDAVTALLAYRINASDLSAQRKRILLSTLQSAEAAFADGNCEAGLRQLERFENKVRAQVEKSDASLAGRLIAGAQAIIRSGCGD